MTAPDFRGDPPTHYLCSLLEDAGVPHLFTTRHFPGVSAFREPGPPLGAGAQDLLATHALAAQPAAFLKQVHGASVAQVSNGGHAGQGDALMSDKPGLPVVVFSADCVPVLLYDPEGRRVAAIHAGWRGTVQGVAGAAVGGPRDGGGAAQHFLAAIGPAIGAPCLGGGKPVVPGPQWAAPRRRGAWGGGAGDGQRA